MVRGGIHTANHRLHGNSNCGIVTDCSDLRLSPPRAKAEPAPAARTRSAVLPLKGDNRLPLPGTVITRAYKGDTLQVKVLPRGFEFEGEVYKSLSAVAKAITGSHCNGFHFFRLTKGAA